MSMMEFMLAGGAEGYAGNRAGDLREQNKQKIAEAREMRLAKYSADLGAARDEKQNQFSAGESAKDRDSRATLQSQELASREKIASEGNATQLAAANISASGSGRGRRETDHDIVGQPQKEMDEDGQPTGRYLVARRNGDMEVVDPADLPMRGGGSNVSPKQKQENAAAEDKYVKARLGETSGWLSSDAEDFKQYGGSRTKAEQAFRDEYRAQNGGGAKPQPMAERGKAAAAPEVNQEATGSVTPAQTAAPQMSANANAILDAARKANPGVADADLINALSASEQYGKYFK